jgi:Flp pilus assembly pilin Flp
MMRKFWNDECGAVLSAELVLVMTILVIGMVVGLSEIQHAVVQELNDVAEAIGAVNQSYSYTGFEALKTAAPNARKSFSAGSAFGDDQDDCDRNQCDIACLAAAAETTKP